MKTLARISAAAFLLAFTALLFVPATEPIKLPVQYDTPFSYTGPADSIVFPNAFAAQRPRRRIGGRSRPQNGGVAAGPVPGDSVALVVVIGQSLGVGVSGTPVQSVHASTQDFIACQNDTVDAGGINALSENLIAGCQSAAEKPTSGMGAALRALANPTTSMVFVPCAVSGSTIEQWWDDPTEQTNLTNCKAKISEVVSAVAADPSTYGSVSGDTYLLAYVQVGHESNDGVGTTEAGFRTDLDGMWTELVTWSQAQTSQTTGPYFFITPPSTWSVGGTEADRPGAVAAQYAKCAEESDVYCSPGNYAFDGEAAGSQLHMSGPGYRAFGEKVGEMIYYSLWQGAGYMITPSAVSAVGTTLIIDWNANGTVTQEDGGTNTRAHAYDNPGTDGGGSEWGGCLYKANAGLTIIGGANPTVSDCSTTGTQTTCTLSAELSPGTSYTLGLGQTGVPATLGFGCRDNADNPYTLFRDERHFAPHTDDTVVDIRDAGPAPDSGIHFTQTAAINMDDVDDYLSCGTPSFLAGVASYTICYWQYEGTLGVNEYIYGAYQTSNRLFTAFSRITNNRYYNPAGTGTGEYAETTGGPFTNATWVHTCVRRDSAGATDADRFRVWNTDEGTACSSCENSLTYVGTMPSGNTPSPSTYTMYFGAATSAAPSWGSATSYLDEFAVWVPAISATQIETEVMTGQAVDLNSLATAGNPTRWWRFESDVTEETGNNDCTATGSPTYETSNIP